MAKAKDLTGQRFGRLVVQYKNGHIGKDVAWHCICDCGGKLYSDCTGEVDVRAYCLTSGMTQSCGCLKRDRTHESNFIDLTGRKIGKLTVLGIHHRDDNNRNYYWECECDCPAHNKVIVKGTVLNKERTLSCGCLRGNHPQEKKPKVDLVDKRFGKLVVKKYLGSSIWKCLCDCGNIVEVYTGYLNDMSVRSCGKVGCPYSKGSFPEHEISEHLANIVGKDNIILHDKSVLLGKEIDIYLPKFGIGIEYNGSVYHATVNGVYADKPKNYHRDKFLLAKEKGIHLISIFDVDYLDNKDKVLSYLDDLITGNLIHDIPVQPIIYTNNDYDDGEWLREFGYIDVEQSEPESYVYKNKYLVYRCGKTKWVNYSFTQ